MISQLIYKLNTADIVFFCFFLFFFLDGWRKGFLKSVLGPVTFVFASIFGMIYYDTTQNAVKAIVFTMVTTLILNIVLLVLLMLGKRSVDPAYKDYSPLLSRVAGSVVNIAWQGGIFLMIVLLVTLAPLNVYGFNQMRGRIQESFSYAFLVRNTLDKLPAVKKTVTAFSIFGNPDQMQRLSSTPEFQSFFLNEKVQALLEDEEFMDNVQKKNIAQLLSNPKILEIYDDEDLMENFGRLAKKIYSLDFPPVEQSTPSTE